MYIKKTKCVNKWAIDKWAIVGMVTLLTLPTLKADTLTTTQLHATLGIVTNFILSDESKNFTPPKKTGQVNSYETNGLQVFDSSLKDDGFYQKGITPNYSRNDGDEIVTDHITGLQWQDDAAVASVTKPWLETIKYNQCRGIGGETLDVTQCIVTAGDTATSYCLNLTLGGDTDWRLPTARELQGLSKFGQVNPALDPTFQNVPSGFYWSSTTHIGSVAWDVNFYSGGREHHVKTYSFSVRCVRAGQ